MFWQTNHDVIVANVLNGIALYIISTHFEVNCPNFWGFRVFYFFTIKPINLCDIDIVLFFDYSFNKAFNESFLIMPWLFKYISVGAEIL